ncbi:MAG: PQQ-binding-like beta-propeller repeat protein [Cellvibrionaceae bacterium]
MKKIHVKATVLAATLLLSGLPLAGAHAQTGAPNGEWHTWGGDLGFTRYADLDQINKKNVEKLSLAWRWQSLPHGNRPDNNLKATPLMIDGVLYTPTGVHQAAALDPATGETLWVFSPEPADIGGRNPSSSSRSLAYWTDGKNKRLFHNTLDGRLISIDAKTGEADPAFGESGYIILKNQLTDREVPFVGSSSPPTVVGDVVVAQVVTYITSPNKEAPPGHIRGYDVRTGELLWTFHTVPQKGEFGNDTWEKESWKYTGNTGVWTMMSADDETGYIYLPVEAPSHDFYGGHRLGDNLFAQSLVCLDAKTGKRVWHYQMVHHGLWDYDPPSAPILGDIVVEGKKIKTVTQLTKQGMSFVFNRVTGEPVWPIEEKSVPQSTVPGERSAPTQPFPTKPAPYVPHGYSEENLIGFTPELRKEAIKIAEQYVRGPIYTPPTRIDTTSKNGTQGTWVQPGYGGGSNWNGGAFDVETGYMFVPTRNNAMIARLAQADPSLTDWDYIRATTMTAEGPQGLPIVAPPWSKVTATDMNKGEHVWWRAIGSAPDSVRHHPALKGLDLDFDNMGYPGVRPVPLVTKSLFFMAESGNLSGDPGGKLFRAYDKATGKTVAEIELPSKVSGGPMTYQHKGKQYIVMAIATQEHPAELIALALPDKGKEKEKGKAKKEVPSHSALDFITQGTDAKEITASKETLELGRKVFAETCSICHGGAGEGMAGGAPALFGMTDLTNILRAVTQGGVEMPPMKQMLTGEQIDAVSKFVAVELKRD